MLFQVNSHYYDFYSKIFNLRKKTVNIFEKYLKIYDNTWKYLNILDHKDVVKSIKYIPRVKSS